MRVFLAAVLIALLVGPVYAQKAAPAPAAQPPKSPQEIESERAAEKAYKNSLGNIPDKPPVDPWGDARSMDLPKTNAAAPTKRTKTGGTTN
jgi:hypothetical protein